MKHLLPALLLALLAGCTTTSSSAVDTACNDLQYAQLAFTTFTLVHPVSSLMAQREQTAYTVASTACAVRTASTLSKVNAALTLIEQIKTTS